MNQPNFATRWLVFVFVFLLGAPAWAQRTNIGLSGPVLPDPGHPGISRDQQIQAGQQAMRQVYQQMPVLPDSSPVTKYVQKLGAKLAKQIPRQNSWPYQFHVLQESDINAFALPGGPIFINVGTITAAANEAQLAGVIGHEMSHVYLQHSAKQATSGAAKIGAGAQIGAGILGAILGNSAIGNIGRMAIQLGGSAIMLRYSREDEAQADATGAIIMYKAGYDPRAMAQFFQKLEQQGGAGVPQFLSDHPNPGNRVAAVDHEIAEWPSKNLNENGPGFDTAKQQAGGVKAYTAQQIAQGAKQGVWAQQNARNGAVPSGAAANPGAAAGNGGASPSPGNLANLRYDQVKPSSNFQQFQGNAFTIAYPDNWQAGSDPNSGGATIAPAVAVSSGSVAYGVVIGAANNVPAGSLDQATQQLVQSLQQQNPGLQASGSPNTIDVNGTQGESVDLMGTSPVQKNGKPEQEHDWLVTVPGQQGGMVYLVFIAPQDSFGKLKSTYQKMLNSLQVH